MPAIRVWIYRDEEGVPLMEWLAQVKSKKALAKCAQLIDLLRKQGFELRRPYTDILRDEIYELRTHVGTVQYRILYFYHEKDAVLSHGCVKKKAKVPDKEIDAAIERKTKYQRNPEGHRIGE